MQGLWIQLLGNNIGMAIQAEIRHPRTTPEGRMTGCTTPANFCVRSNAAKRIARLGIELTRSEKNVALPYHHGYQDDNRQDCKKDARASETTET